MSKEFDWFLLMRDRLHLLPHAAVFFLHVAPLLLLKLLGFDSYKILNIYLY
jgi:hypothetical protein